MDMPSLHHIVLPLITDSGVATTDKFEVISPKEPGAEEKLVTVALKYPVESCLLEFVLSGPGVIVNVIKLFWGGSISHCSIPALVIEHVYTTSSPAQVVCLSPRLDVSTVGINSKPSVVHSSAFPIVTTLACLAAMTRVESGEKRMKLVQHYSGGK